MDATERRLLLLLAEHVTTAIDDIGLIQDVSAGNLSTTAGLPEHAAQSAIEQQNL